ncbi:MAG: S-methyl-5-thioribose-1-phosphate isomerase [Actinomycetia bacterium]|nr:S-methyl-5-thioribose-1-phosphate isomerase [Actinomycetes bacterium]
MGQGGLASTEILRLEADRVVMLDQRALPEAEVELECRCAADVAEAIRVLAVRGAPVIGIAGAMGVALAASVGENVDEAASLLVGARPTAANLAWAVREVRREGDEPDLLAARARRLHADEVERCLAMSRHALSLFEAGSAVVTHCNTGALATGGHGTALGAIITAWANGLVDEVFVDETRPLLQGARLTAWELERAGIACTVIVDAAAPALMAAGRATHVVVGADRIAANGDTANKIGTYGLALSAREHGLGFVVVAPSSTVDVHTATGAEIVVEERASDEISSRWRAFNPAFDVTPAGLIGAIVTEQGVLRPPYEPGLRSVDGARVGSELDAEASPTSPAVG